MSDPGFLARNNMEVVDGSGRSIDPSSIDWMDPSSFRFRQRPGSSNALGLVKFMFPNQFNVYLHDTPTDSLFGRAARLFSHGCIRVEQPEELARYVLRDQPEWTTDRIERPCTLETSARSIRGSRFRFSSVCWTARSPDGWCSSGKTCGIDARLTADGRTACAVCGHRRRLRSRRRRT
jgi:hypothetical protein